MKRNSNSSAKRPFKKIKVANSKEKTQEKKIKLKNSIKNREIPPKIKLIIIDKKLRFPQRNN